MRMKTKKREGGIKYSGRVAVDYCVEAVMSLDPSTEEFLRHMAITPVRTSTLSCARDQLWPSALHSLGRTTRSADRVHEPNE